MKGKQRLLAVFLGLLVACGPANNPSSAPPSQEIDPGQLLFVAFFDHGEEEFTPFRLDYNSIDTAGIEQLRLTNNTTSDLDPVWSPDGAHIAFISNRDGDWEIYMMTADGSKQIQLTSNSTPDHSPAWSPDGKRIVYVSGGDGFGDIYAINVDSSGQESLTGDSRNMQPVWSPDGTQIAFAGVRDNGNWAMYVMAADGSGLSRLTNNDKGTACSSARWSPDGKKIAFICKGDEE